MTLIILIAHIKLMLYLYGYYKWHLIDSISVCNFKTFQIKNTIAVPTLSINLVNLNIQLFNALLQIIIINMFNKFMTISYILCVYWSWKSDLFLFQPQTDAKKSTPELTADPTATKLQNTNTDTSKPPQVPDVYTFLYYTNICYERYKRGLTVRYPHVVCVITMRYPCGNHAFIVIPCGT